MPTAVHFGAGNIGRGFVGLMLHEAGYEVVFADVNAGLIDQLAAADSYAVHEMGEEATTHVVTDFRAINCRDEEGARARDRHRRHRHDRRRSERPAASSRRSSPRRHRGPCGVGPARLAVFACENAINATDLLQADVRAEPRRRGRCRRASTRAVFAEHRDRPHRARAGRRAPGLDVTVETSSSGSSTARPSRAASRPRSRRALGRRPRAVHRAQALHGEHRARHRGVPRLRGRAHTPSRRDRDARIRDEVRGRARRDPRAARREVRPRRREQQAYGEKIARPASPTRSCPTRSSASAASRCAS